MTFQIGHVQGGTDAGWRRVKALRSAWRCECGRDNKPYNGNCPTCYRPRPKE